jgi:hypothetical protein
LELIQLRERPFNYSEYFLPSTVKAWNDLPLPTRNLESLNSFKSLINTKNTNVPAHYYVGCRLGCQGVNLLLFMIKVWTDLNTALFSSSFRLTEPKISRFSEIVSGMSKSEKKSCRLKSRVMSYQH